MKAFLKEHSVRYPNMKTNDYLKLIYQHCFGPRHFHGNPKPNVIHDYILKEMDQMNQYKRPHLVDIGNDYVRVDLMAIVEGRYTIEKIEEAFLKSMETTIDIDYTNQLFQNCLDELLEMSQEGIIKIDFISLEQDIKQYLKQGIHPVHHSKQYSESYHPHYRVIHRHYLF